MALAFGVGIAAAGACFQSVEFGCDEDAQCRVGSAEGVCAAEGFCAYEDESCGSGQRFGPYAGALAEACVVPGGTTGTSTTDVVGSESSSSVGTAPGSTSTTGSSSGSETGCPLPCVDVDVGEVLWSVVDQDRGAGTLLGVDVWNDELVAVGYLGTDAEVEYLARYGTDDGTFVDEPSGERTAGRAWDVAVISRETIAVVGERPSALESAATLTAFDSDWQMRWARPRESAGPDVLRAVSSDGASVVAVGSFDAEALLVVHDSSDGSELDVRTSTAGKAASAAYWSVAATTSGASLGGSFGEDEVAWVRRVLAGGAFVSEPAGLPSGRALGIASVGASLEIVAIGGAGPGQLVLTDAKGVVASETPLPEGEVTAVAALEGGGWIAVGTDLSRGTRPWFSIWTMDFEQVAEHVFDDRPGTRAEDVAVDGSVAYIAGGTDAPWLAAVVAREG